MRYDFSLVTERMKPYIEIGIFILILGCTSNQNKENKKIALPRKDTLSQAPLVVPKINNKLDVEIKTTSKKSKIKHEDDLKEQVATTIINFLKWYQKNRDLLNDIELVNNYKQGVIDSSKCYSVNFKGTEKYLSELKKSGYLSETCLNNLRFHFKKCAEKFSKYCQYEETPIDMYPDLITCGNDFEVILLENSYEEYVFKYNLTVTKKTKNEVHADVILITSQSLLYDLSLHNNSWYIDKINCNEF